MSFTWQESIGNADWKELSALYKAAGLGEKSPARLKTAFSNSMFTCMAYDDGAMVGAGRALADGVDCSYICDVAVLPAHQGRGIGRQIITNLVSRSKGHMKIILYAVPGTESFYSKLGFSRMRTAMAMFHDQQGARTRGYLHDS